jgi:hypothetical protein
MARRTTLAILTLCTAVLLVFAGPSAAIGCSACPSKDGCDRYGCFDDGCLTCFYDCGGSNCTWACGDWECDSP